MLSEHSTTDPKTISSRARVLEHRYTAVALVDPGGLVRGIAPGTAVITGSQKTTSGSANITVTLGGITSIQVSTTDVLSSVAYGSSEQFVATATANGDRSM